jgi:hypothetical protein
LFFVGLFMSELDSQLMMNISWLSSSYPQRCINESREDINWLRREEKFFFILSYALSSSVIRIVHVMILFL